MVTRANALRKRLHKFYTSPTPESLRPTFNCTLHTPTCLPSPTMDADISDILASVSAPQLSQRAVDLQTLTRAWINERTSPELLPYPSELIGRCTSALQSQIEVIESMTGAMDPATNFTLVILQTELERIKFLLRSFLRARIAKVCQSE